MDKLPVIVQPIEWWQVTDFQGRTNKVTSADEKYGHTYVTEHLIPIPDNEVVCDVCNAEVTEFPCPVVNKYALCSSCRKGWNIKSGDEEYFETVAYRNGEAPDPGVNFGGRKKKG